MPPVGGGRLRVESVAGFPWNRWQVSRGISGNFRVEQVAGFAWKQWQVWRGIRTGAPPPNMSFSTWGVLTGDATYQRTPISMISLGKWAPLKLTAIVALPHDAPLLIEGEHTSN